MFRAIFRRRSEHARLCDDGRTAVGRLAGRMINYTVRQAPETRRIQNWLVVVYIVKRESLVSAQVFASP